MIDRTSLRRAPKFVGTLQRPSYEAGSYLAARDESEDELLVGRNVPPKLAHSLQQLLAFRTQGFILKEELQKVDEVQSLSNMIFSFQR